MHDHHGPGDATDGGATHRGATHHDDHVAWDERYTRDGATTSLWSGHPNGSLVAEVAGLEPGSALDVGCGEGADAVWLAEQGWHVTALDPSAVALGRARDAAVRAGVRVGWVHAGLLDLPTDAGPFDLVSAQYAVLRRDGARSAVRALLDRVAPGGRLLVVHHLVGAHHGSDHGSDHENGHGSDEEGDHDVDPTDHVMPADVRDALDDGWLVEVDETRARPGPMPAEARHVDDVVLRARRLRPGDPTTTAPTS